MYKKNNRVELLAPAGNIESFKAACQNGADAIYMGIDKFNARVMAQNFDVQEYIDCINYAHIRGVKVYLTLNTLLYDDEIKEAVELVLKLYSKGLDAVIVQDIGIAMFIHELLPDLALHASTQMSVYSLSQVKYLQKIGFSRIVLARELSIDEIEYICKNSDIEIEVFVHGALCVCFSGQCLLSSTIGNRSANRGNCAQPCRMKYSLYNSKNKEVIKSTYLMSKKDIFGIDYINRLVSISKNKISLKIEGRNKVASYVAGVTSTYRKYIDKCLNAEFENVSENDRNNLLQLFNRSGMSYGYLGGVKYKDSITLKSPKNTGIYLGRVKDQKGVYVKIKLNRNINLHDGFEIYSDDNVVSNIVTCIKNENGKILNKEAKQGDYIWIGDVNKKVKFGSQVYITSSDSLNKRFRKTYENDVQNKKRTIDICIKIKKDKNLFASIDNKINLSFNYIPEVALNKSITIEKIMESFEKTKDTPFKFNVLELDIDENLFIPASKLNEFRRYILDKLENEYLIDINIDEKINNLDKYISNFEKKYKSICKQRKINIPIKNTLFIYKYNKDIDYIKIYKEKYCKDLDGIYIDVADYIKYREDIIKKYICNINVYVSIPNVVLDKLDKLVVQNLENMLKDRIKGFLLGSLSYLEKILSYKNKYEFLIFADYTLNVTNKYSAMYYNSIGFDVITPLFDISTEYKENISKYVNIQIVNDYITLMTSRYCILGSILADRNEKCSMPCIQDTYYLKDTYGYKYNIICNNLDCIMKIIKQVGTLDIKNYNFDKLVSIRNCKIW